MLLPALLAVAAISEDGPWLRVAAAIITRDDNIVSSNAAERTQRLESTRDWAAKVDTRRRRCRRRRRQRSFCSSVGRCSLLFVCLTVCLTDSGHDYFLASRALPCNGACYTMAPTKATTVVVAACSAAVHATP